MLLLIVGGIGAWWINGTAAADPATHALKTFSVTKGEGVRQIANNLKAQGLIKDPVVFFLMLRQQGLDGKIQAGEFQISPSMTAAEVAKTLQTATNDVRITIPEGKRAEEIAEILQNYLPTYQAYWKQRLILNEGYLFPDTYSFPKDATVDDVIKTMTDNFERKYGSITDGKKATLSEKQIVTIASMVEREAKYPEDRPLVSSVILNRLNSNMPLQIDATVQYALGYQKDEKTWWKKELSLDDLKLSSPYNTYQNTGLPPAPIANPGLDVLNAVINAPETQYVYYVSDKSGHNHYAITSEEHNANIQKYGL